jgi:hypothetical protein
MDEAQTLETAKVDFIGRKQEDEWKTSVSYLQRLSSAMASH